MTDTVICANKRKTFPLPIQIISHDMLRMVTGDALAAYVLIALKLYRAKTTECMISDFEMQRWLDMSRSMVRNARTELRARNLIQFDLSQQGARYRFSDEEPQAVQTNLTQN